MLIFAANLDAGNGIDDLFQPATSFQDCLPGNVTPITPKQIEQIKDNLLIGESALALVRVFLPFASMGNDCGTWTNNRLRKLNNR